MWGAFFGLIINIKYKIMFLIELNLIFVACQHWWVRAMLASDHGAFDVVWLGSGGVDSVWARDRERGRFA